MKTHKQSRITLSIIRMSYVFTLIALLAVGANAVWGNPPRLLNYQGKLTDTTSGEPVAGTVSITFSIYDTLTGGSPLWTEAHGNVIVTSGLFNVVMSS